MSKAILVIDMPKNCSDCPCLNSDDSDNWCAVTGEAIYSFKTRDKFCPFIPAPEVTMKDIGIDIDTRLKR